MMSTDECFALAMAESGGGTLQSQKSAMQANTSGNVASESRFVSAVIVPNLSMKG